MPDQKPNPANLTQVVTKAAKPAVDAKNGDTQNTTPVQTTAAPAAKVPEPTQSATPVPSELATLKARAKVMGIDFSPNIGLDALRERVNTKANAVEALNEPEPIVQVDTVKTAVKGESKLQAELRIRKELIAEQTKLVRCRIECMNPAKGDLKGDLFTTGNRYVGKISRFIPFGEQTDNGWHIPFMLYNMLKNKKFLKLSREKIKGTNNYVNRSRLVPEFSIEVLPPLSKKEMKALGDRQQAQAGLEAEY